MTGLDGEGRSSEISEADRGEVESACGRRRTADLRVRSMAATLLESGETCKCGQDGNEASGLTMTMTMGKITGLWCCVRE